ncbi:MAG: hypothetical protein ABIG11_08290 [bacterium]
MLRKRTQKASILEAILSEKKPENHLFFPYFFKNSSMDPKKPVLAFNGESLFDSLPRGAELRPYSSIEVWLMEVAVRFTYFDGMFGTHFIFDLTRVAWFVEQAQELLAEPAKLTDNRLRITQETPGLEGFPKPPLNPPKTALGSVRENHVILQTLLASNEKLETFDDFSCENCGARVHIQLANGNKNSDDTDHSIVVNFANVIPIVEEQRIECPKCRKKVVGNDWWTS